MIDQTSKAKIANLCRRGFSTGDTDLYGQIDAILADEEQTEQVQTLRRLAQAGDTLASKRFAFPHIEDHLDSV